MLVPGLGLALRACVWFGVLGEGGLETWDAIKVAAAQQQQQQQQQYAAVCSSSSGDNERILADGDWGMECRAYTAWDMQ